MVRLDNIPLELPLTQANIGASPLVTIPIEVAQPTGMNVLLSSLGFLLGYHHGSQVVEDKVLRAFAEWLVKENNSALESWRNWHSSLKNQSLAVANDHLTQHVRTFVLPCLETVPPSSTVACGLAGVLLYMKAVKCENGIYFGERNGEYYPIHCPEAAAFYQAWQLCTLGEVVQQIFEYTLQQGTAVRIDPVWTMLVKQALSIMLIEGVRTALISYQTSVDEH